VCVAGKDPELLREVQIYETRQRHAVNTAESYCKWRMDTVKAQLAYEKAAAQQVFEVRGLCMCMDGARHVRSGGVMTVLCYT